MVGLLTQIDGDVTKIKGFAAAAVTPTNASSKHTNARSLGGLEMFCERRTGLGVGAEGEGIRTDNDEDKRCAQEGAVR